MQHTCPLRAWIWAICSKETSFYYCGLVSFSVSRLTSESTVDVLRSACLLCASMNVNMSNFLQRSNATTVQFSLLKLKMYCGKVLFLITEGNLLRSVASECKKLQRKIRMTGSATKNCVLAWRVPIINLFQDHVLRNVQSRCYTHTCAHTYIHVHIHTQGTTPHTATRRMTLASQTASVGR
jgi:hypothetical protein